MLILIKVLCLCWRFDMLRGLGERRGFESRNWAGEKDTFLGANQESRSFHSGPKSMYAAAHALVSVAAISF